MVGVAVGVECGVGWSEDDAVVGGAGEVAEHMLGCSPVRCGGLGHVAGQRSHGLGNIRSGAGCQVHEVLTGGIYKGSKSSKFAVEAALNGSGVEEHIPGIYLGYS